MQMLPDVTDRNRNTFDKCWFKCPPAVRWMIEGAVGKRWFLNYRLLTQCEVGTHGDFYDKYFFQVTLSCCWLYVNAILPFFFFLSVKQDDTANEE